MEDQSPRKILNVLGRLNRGGAELRLIQALPTAIEGGVRVDFCCLSGMAGELDSQVSRLGGKIHHLKLGNGFPARFVRLLREENYEVVHSHVHLVSGLILLLAAVAHTPVRIAHFRNTNDGHTPNLLRSVRDKFLKILIKIFASRILGVSEGALTSAWSPRWAQDPRCAVIYNGVALEKPEARNAGRALRDRYGISPTEPLLIHIGRLAPAKNHEHLLGVLAAMNASREAPKLILVGRYVQDRLEKLLQLAEDLGVRENLIVAGEHASTISFIDAGDLMIFPSRWEGLPGAVLECLSRGLRVLGSDIPGICEIRDRVLGVETLPIDVGYSIWADRAWRMLNETPESERKIRTSTIPTGSPFDLRTSSAALVSEWTRYRRMLLCDVD